MAPAEMNFLLPVRRALCMAENATHNLLTPRGALVRDAHVCSHYLTESITLFADRADVLFASHHWPTWAASGWPPSCPNSATCTPTCTTRPCGCSTRA